MLEVQMQLHIFLHKEGTNVNRIYTDMHRWFRTLSNVQLNA